ncbi:MAG: DNA primase [Dehalococcoidia bacterium]|nr:DNA primase [Dehalococcoidia bacterium]
MSTIDDVKARLDIVETVGSYVADLKRAGRTYKACCPFHNERTPSFTVDPERGTWHCFGACSTGGDVIEFVRRAEGLDFREALRVCAERAGVELRPPTAREREQREAHERLLQANEAAAIFFQSQLLGPGGADALAYLEKRGVDATTRQTWQLGYAPAGWRTLVEHLTARGFTEGDLVAAGLAVESDDRSRGAYDRFRDRVIFPTRDARGRMIGFGARALRPEDEPKYLNTPQTPLFDKGASLYGIDRAHEEARRADRAIVVEGYMDVIAAHQFGQRNVVASMGTAITPAQMEQLKRFTQNVVLALDADVAGAEATLRAVEVAAQASDRTSAPTVDWRGLVSYQDVLQADIRVVTLPAGEDPDSLVRADPERFRTLIAAARPVLDHLFDAVSARFDLTDVRARSRALDALAPAVAGVTDAVVRAHYVQRLARMLQLDEQAVVALLSRQRGQRPAPVANRKEERQARKSAVTSAPARDGEAGLLQLLLHRAESLDVRDHIEADVFEDSAHRRLFELWRDGQLASPPADLDEELREPYVALTTTIPDVITERFLDSKLVRDMAVSWARGLRRHRVASRLLPAARQRAEQASAARRGGAPVLERAVQQLVDAREERGDPVPESEADAALAAQELNAIAARQRELARTFRIEIGRQPAAVVGGDSQGETP